MQLTDKIKRVGLFQAIDDVTGNLFSYLKYQKCRYKGKPYFGSYLAATQGKSNRHYYMQELLKYYCFENKGKIELLEIGSWAGGSAITWAEAIKKHSRNLGTVYCLDPWINYIENFDENNSWIHQTMMKGLKNNKIVNLFNHNIAASRLENMVFPLRGSSDQLLPMFKQKQFDIIFIDGNHLFDAAFRDITNAAPLVKNGGIICGDDLELQAECLATVDLEMLGNVDVAIEPTSHQRFHPGVTRAIWEFFHQEVSCWEGLWAMRKQDTSWERLTFKIDSNNVCVPEHLS